MMQNTINTQIDKNTKLEESYFKLKNYVLENQSKRINETEFLCDIEVRLTDENFPVKLELYNCETGEELLNGKNKVEGILIPKNSEFERKYKLVVLWEKKENMSAESDVNIIVSASQI